MEYRNRKVNVSNNKHFLFASNERRSVANWSSLDWPSCIISQYALNKTCLWYFICVESISHYQLTMVKGSPMKTRFKDSHVNTDHVRQVLPPRYEVPLNGRAAQMIQQAQTYLFIPFLRCHLQLLLVAVFLSWTSSVGPAVLQWRCCFIISPWLPSRTCRSCQQLSSLSQPSTETLFLLAEFQPLRGKFFITSIYASFGCSGLYCLPVSPNCVVTLQYSRRYIDWLGGSHWMSGYCNYSHSSLHLPWFGWLRCSATFISEGLNLFLTAATVLELKLFLVSTQNALCTFMFSGIK